MKNLKIKRNNTLGFTLVELIGAIILVGALLLLITPTIQEQVNKGRQKLYDDQIEGIKQASALYISNINLENGERMKFTLSQLKQAGLVDIDIQNPLTKELLPNDMEITVSNTNGVLKYDCTVNGTNQNPYDVLPQIELNGNILEYVNLKDIWHDPASTASLNGNELEVKITGTVNTNKKGIYYLTYQASNNGISNQIIQTVIVKDMTPPTLTFPATTLQIPLSQVNTYDFKNDITVTDNSDDAVNVSVSHNILRTGTYSVEYKATDSSGNTTTKWRQVIIK